jgi:hypothetical protein
VTRFAGAPGAEPQVHLCSARTGRGVPVTVNSDDPTMFGVKMSDEVAAPGTGCELDEAAS